MQLIEAIEKIATFGEDASYSSEGFEMAKCVYCYDSGWLLEVDEFGFCKRCSVVHNRNIRDRSRIIIESNKIIEKSNNIKTILSRFEVVFQHLDELLPYEEKGIGTLNHRPSELIEIFKKDRAEKLESAIQDLNFKARQKAQDAATDAGKLGGYEKSVEVLGQLMDEVEDVSAIELAIFDMRVERDNLKCDLLYQKADTQLAKGQEKKAVETLIDGLMSLKHDQTPDSLQADKIKQLQQKVRELGGEPPDW